MTHSQPTDDANAVPESVSSQDAQAQPPAGTPAEPADSGSAEPCAGKPSADDREECGACGGAPESEQPEDAPRPDAPRPADAEPAEQPCVGAEDVLPEPPAEAAPSSAAAACGSCSADDICRIEDLPDDSAAQTTDAEPAADAEQMTDAAPPAADVPESQPDGSPQPEAADEAILEEPQQPLPPIADLRPVLEALLFAAEGQVSANRLAEATGMPLADVRQALAELQMSYNLDNRGFALEEIAGGWQLFSRPVYAPYIERFQKKQTKTKLSAAALETLAIIAYKQPIGRADVESIRGVQAGPILRMLIDKGMVHIVGRQEVIGRPFLYGTTKRFLEHFGLKSLTDLPQAEQLQMP